MKKVLLPICLALLTWTGSGSVLEAQAQSGPHKVVVAKKKATNKANTNEVRQFYKHFLKTYILGGKDIHSNPKFRAYLSEELIQKLHERYIAEYDDEDGTGLAVWLFRGGGQDPDDAEMLRTLSVQPAKNNWYVVKMTSRGERETLRVRIVKKNKRFLLTDVENPNW